MSFELLLDAVRNLEHELAQTRNHETEPATDGINHGTLTGYTTHACRCPDCRAANTAYSRAYRQRHKVSSHH